MSMWWTVTFLFSTTTFIYLFISNPNLGTTYYELLAALWVFNEILSDTWAWLGLFACSCLILDISVIVLIVSIFISLLNMSEISPIFYMCCLIIGHCALSCWQSRCVLQSGHNTWVRPPLKFSPKFSILVLYLNIVFISSWFSLGFFR